MQFQFFKQSFLSFLNFKSSWLRAIRLRAPLKSSPSSPRPFSFVNNLKVNIFHMIKVSLEQTLTLFYIWLIK